MARRLRVARGKGEGRRVRAKRVESEGGRKNGVEMKMKCWKDGDWRVLGSW